MAETTHEALVRQVAATEEMLAYFQGQRNAFQADVSHAQAGFEELSGDLKGVVKDLSERSFYIDATNGDDDNEGTSVSPLASIQEAYRRMLPGGSFEIRLRRGDTYTVSDSDRCNIDNATVVHLLWGDQEEPKPVIQNLIDTSSGAAYSNGFSGIALNAYFFSCRFIVGLDETDTVQTRFNGLFTGSRGSLIYMESCVIELGDVDFAKSAYGELMTLVARNVDITAQDGATAGLLSTESGILRVSSSTIPADKTWYELIGSPERAADGEVRSFLTNIQL